MLACDGIWDVKTNEQCIDFVRENVYKEGAFGSQPIGALEKGLTNLLDNCCAESTGDGIGTDNMTAIIVELKPRN